MRTDRQNGFTLLELIIVVVLVVLLFGFAAMKLLPLRGAAEQAHVLHTVGALRAGLGLQATSRVLDRQVDGLRQLGDENPLDWLAITPPVSTAGTVDAMERGRWLWIEERRELVYRLRYPEYVEGAWNHEWLRFQVHLEQRNRSLTRLELQWLDSARWQLPDELLPDTELNSNE
jgi:prepilin-type N-terminal cleavage/methylation domain-containing protein